MQADAAFFRMSGRIPTRWRAGFCLALFCCAPLCSRALSSADSRWMAVAANLLTNPPAVDYLIYSDTYNGKTTFNRVLYQAGNFVIKTTETANLDSLVLRPTTHIIGKSPDSYWYFEGKFEPILNATDVSMLDSTNPAVAQNASRIVDHVKLYARQGLTILCLCSQATPLDSVQLNGSAFAFTSLMGAAVSGTIRPGVGTNEVVLDFLNIRGGKQRFEYIVCHFDPAKFKGAFPFLIERSTRFSLSDKFQNIETFQIISFHPTRWPIHSSRFQRESAFGPGLAGMWYCENNQATFHSFDPKTDARVEAFGRILRPGTVRHIHLLIWALSIAGISLLVFAAIKHKTRTA